MNEMTRADFMEQMVAFERRINERFDLLERMVALGFDDTSDKLSLLAPHACGERQGSVLSWRSVVTRDSTAAGLEQRGDARARG